MALAFPVCSRFTLLDIEVDALTGSDLDSFLEIAIARQERSLLANHNLHSLYLSRRSPRMRAFYAAADRIHADGISIVLLGRLLGLPLTKRHRIGYLDWLPRLMRKALEKNWRVYYLGSKPGTLEKGLATLRRNWPGLQIDGRHGYFDKAPHSLDNEDVLREIHLYQPHLLMVGMGMPIQEHWIVENFDRLPRASIVACGALLDYVAGAIPTPPRWLGPIGLEWLFRLLSEPQRLAGRYLIEPWSVAAALGSHLFRQIAPFEDKSSL